MKANEKCTSIVPAAYHNQCCYASLTNHISHKHVGTKCMSVRPFLYLSTEVARFNPLQREFVTPSACFVPFVKSTRQLWIVFREVCRCWKCLNSERQAIQRNPCSATFAILYQIVHFRVVALLFVKTCLLEVPRVTSSFQILNCHTQQGQMCVELSMQQGVFWRL